MIGDRVSSPPFLQLHCPGRSVLFLSWFFYALCHFLKLYKNFYLFLKGQFRQLSSSQAKDKNFLFVLAKKLSQFSSISTH